MQGMYSMRSPAVKRLMKEAQELHESTEQYECHPLEDNLFEWHFTIRGPSESEFDGGLYHGRIILPPEYPMKPPSIILLTPNGRFEINKKICLSISGHHPESWQPSWSLRTALLAIIGFMPTHSAGALGSLDYTPEERKILAKKSQEFHCPECGCINNILKPVTEASKKTTEEARQLATQIDFKDEKEKNAALKTAANIIGEKSGIETTNVFSTTETSASITKPQDHVLPSVTPTQFGQLPFRMPYYPTFPQMNIPTGTPNLAQIPRFPLPFVSPFLPPFPPLRNSPSYPPFPMVPGMLVPPWQQRLASQCLPVVTPSTTNLGNASEINVTTTNADLAASSVQTNEEAPIQPNRDTPPKQTEHVQDTSDSTSEASSTQEGLRHRTKRADLNTEAAHVNERVGRSAEINESNHRGNASPAVIIFAVFLITIIALLVLRRLYIMKVFSLL